MDGVTKDTLSTTMASNAEIQEFETDKRESTEEKVTNVNVKDLHDEVVVDNPRNLFNKKSITFMDLYPEIKQIIFKKLNLSSKYNLSLVWKDMAHELWRSIDVNKRWENIVDLEDLEHAGVLASAGYMIRSRKDWLSIDLTNVDVSGIPENIINNLVKIVNYGINLRGVKGWRTSMFNDVNVESLIIRHMHLLSGPEEKPVICKFFSLWNVRGDWHGLINNRRSEYDPTDQIKTNWCFGDMEIKGLVDTEDSHNMNLNIGMLHLRRVKGNLSSLFANIKLCDELVLCEIEPSLLSNLNMTEILNDKVKILEIYSPLPDWLIQYDGLGMCHKIKFLWRYYESYGFWAKERRWEVADCEKESVSDWSITICRPH